MEGNKKICNINRMDSNGDALPGIQKIIVRRRQKNGSNGKDAPVCKKNVQLAVYDMLDQMEAEYGDGEAKDVIAEANIYGNVSKFSITVKEGGCGTIMTLAMLAPCCGLSIPGQQRALTAVADRIAQHLENVLVMKGVRYQPPEDTGAAAQ